MSSNFSTSRQSLLSEIQGLYNKERGQVIRASEFSIPASQKCIDSSEIMCMTDAVLDGWLTSGRYTKLFEEGLAEVVGVEHVLTTNSGSSANLLAFSALTSPSLGARALKRGDKVISVAAGFPTTINPILQYGCIPVFFDVDIQTLNIDVDQIEGAIDDSVKAIMLAHTLGNPYDVQRLRNLADKYELWFIEDCCDALGAKAYDKHVGTFGDIGTLSFYPAHHITTGEGGAVFTKSDVLKDIILSIRDWGRDCYCGPAAENTCGKRFSGCYGSLPSGYDHKYVYSHAGYNLKMTDIQAACGVAQLSKLNNFVEARRKNHRALTERLSKFSDFLQFQRPLTFADPSWFGLAITLRDNCQFSRLSLLEHLNSRGIGTRLLFAGNVTRQPYMSNYDYEIVGNLTQTNRVMNSTFWIGVHPNINEQEVEYIFSCFEAFLDV